MSSHTNFNTFLSTDVSWVLASEVTFAAYYSRRSTGQLGLTVTPSCAMLPLCVCVDSLPQASVSGINICCVFQGLEGSLLPPSSKIWDVASYLSIFIWICSDAYIKADFHLHKWPFLFYLVFFYREEFSCVDLLSSISKKGVIQSMLQGCLPSRVQELAFLAVLSIVLNCSGNYCYICIHCIFFFLLDFHCIKQLFYLL